MPENGIGGSHVHIFNLRNQIHLQSSHTNQDSREQGERAPISARPHQYFLPDLMLANLMNMKWSLIVLIPISWINRKPVFTQVYKNVSGFLILNCLLTAFVRCRFIFSRSLILILFMLYGFQMFPPVF